MSQKSLWHWLGSLRRKWAFRSVVVNAIGAGTDLLTMVCLVELLNVPPVISAVAGVTVGSTVNFVLSRKFAFRDSMGSWWNQLGKFALTTGGAMVFHAGMMWLLTHKLHTHYVLSKLFSDLLIFGIGNTLLMRFIVFPKKKKKGLQNA